MEFQNDWLFFFLCFMLTHFLYCLFNTCNVYYYYHLIFWSHSIFNAQSILIILRWLLNQNQIMLMGITEVIPIMSWALLTIKIHYWCLENRLDDLSRDWFYKTLRKSLTWFSLRIDYIYLSGFLQRWRWRWKIKQRKL